MTNFIVSKVYAVQKDLGTQIVGASKAFQDTTLSNPCQPFGNLMSSIITVITVVGGLAFVIFFTMAALKWVIAGGDKTKITEAKEQMTQTTVGLIALVASYFIVWIVGAVLGLDVLNPMKMLFGSC